MRDVQEELPTWWDSIPEREIDMRAFYRVIEEIRRATWTIPDRPDYFTRDEKWVNVGVYSTARDRV